MKKLAFIVLASGMLFSSCKKTWTCTCVDSSVNGGNSGVVLYPNSTKAEAQTNCVGNEAYSNGGSATIKCTLN